MHESGEDRIAITYVPIKPYFVGMTERAAAAAATHMYNWFFSPLFLCCCWARAVFPYKNSFFGR